MNLEITVDEGGGDGSVDELICVIVGRFLFVWFLRYTGDSCDISMWPLFS